MTKPEPLELDSNFVESPITAEFLEEMSQFQFKMEEMAALHPAVKLDQNISENILQNKGEDGERFDGNIIEKNLEERVEVDEVEPEAETSSDFSIPDDVPDMDSDEPKAIAGRLTGIGQL